MNKKVSLVIDGDIVVYQACSASERPIKWDDDLWTLHADEWDAKNKSYQAIKRIITGVGEYFDVEDCIITFSSLHNFRKSIYADYKANRAGKRKPMCIRECIEYLREHWTVEIWDKLEADDVMGILATETRGETVIFSADKDMATIPNAWHMRNLDDEPTKTTHIEADRAWFMQALTGDSTDNYKGIPGVGPVKAKKIIAGCISTEELWKQVSNAFKGAGHTAEEALTQARLARILRAGDYDQEERKVKLWEPLST
jgi:DNA polymerase-1